MEKNGEELEEELWMSWRSPQCRNWRKAGGGANGEAGRGTGRGTGRGAGGEADGEAGRGTGVVAVGRAGEVLQMVEKLVLELAQELA